MGSLLSRPQAKSFGLQLGHASRQRRRPTSTSTDQFLGWNCKLPSLVWNCQHRSRKILMSGSPANTSSRIPQQFTFGSKARMVSIQCLLPTVLTRFTLPIQMLRRSSGAGYLQDSTLPTSSPEVPCLTTPKPGSCFTKVHVSSPVLKMSGLCFLSPMKPRWGHPTPLIRQFRKVTLLSLVAWKICYVAKVISHRLCALSVTFLGTWAAPARRLTSLILQFRLSPVPQRCKMPRISSFETANVAIFKRKSQSTLKGL